jgi:hypothetical protein
LFRELINMKNIKQLFRILVMVLAALLVGTTTASSLPIFNPVDENKYPDNMTMVIELRNGGMTVDTCEVAAFIDGECRGATHALDGLYYLTIAGEGSGQQVEIATCIRGRIVTIDSSTMYANDMNIGTPWEPYVINLNRFAADVNGDGAVDVADIGTVITVMANGSADDPSASADVNGDGMVDVADIANVITVMATVGADSRVCPL